MNNKKLTRLLSPILVTLITFLPAQIALCQSATDVEKIEVESSKVIKVDKESTESEKHETTSSENVPVLKDESKKTAPEPEPPQVKKSSLSTGAIVGISAGAIVLVGAIAALSGGGGGGGESSSSSEPPTAEQLVSAWQATANQPGSGLTYNGTYQLFQGGSIWYDIYVSDGEHLTGNGSWSLVGYQLSIHTNHGSLYQGSFAAGNITSVSLNSNTGWNLNLSR